MTLRPAPFLVGQEAVRPGPDAIFAKGEMAELIRHWDWARTPLGPLSEWPGELLTVVNMLLACPIPMALYWGPQHVMLYNDGYRPFTGARHPGSLGLPGAEVWEEAWNIVGPQVAAAYRAGETVSQENALVPIAVNGAMEDCYWTYSLSPVHGGGRILGVYNVCVSMTEAVMMNRRLRKSEARFRSVAETMPGILYELSPDGQPRYVNQGYTKLTGRDQATIGRDGWADLLHPEEASRVAREFATARTSGVGFASEFRLRDSAGDYRWLQNETRPNFDEAGTLTHWTGAAIDVTARKQSDELMRESEEMFRTLFALAPVGVSMTDLETEHILIANEEMERITGYSLAEMKRMRTREFTHPEDLTGTDEFYQRVRMSGGSHAIEKRYLRRNGEVLWVRVWLKLLRLPGHTGVRTLAVVQDISEARRSQAALVQSEKLAVVGRLAASIAHEINNPLEAVTNLIYLAKGSEENAAARAYLAAAEIELARVAAIATQTLRFHRQSTKARPVRWEDLIESVLAIYQGRIANQGVAVSRRDRAAVPVVCLDGEIRQVLSNLVGNAMDATAGLSGRMLLRSRNATDWKTGRKGLVFTVADTGCGMSARTRKKLFDAFYTTKGNQGTGLGLWVSSEIVHRHLGSLQVRSRNDGETTGTVFCLFLPLDAATPAESEPQDLPGL